MVQPSVLLRFQRTAFRSVTMIKKGDTIPTAKFAWVPNTPSLRDISICGVPQKLSTDDWKGKKIVLFGVPGAFTSTCSVQHLPPFVKSYEKFIAKGVDSVHCVAANDVFVQSAWGRISNVEEKVIMLSDSKLDWLQAAGLTQDLSAVGFGIRSKRFAMVIDDLVVTYIGVENSPGVVLSGADAVLEAL